MDVKTITLKVNGNEHTISINPKLLLVEAIRDVLGLTGTKRGCETVSCGACTVLIDGYAVRGCAVLAMQAIGHEVTTVEGLEKNGVLSPLQVAFLDEGAFQCGFCTPGMIMSARALLNKNPKPNREQIINALEGNLCRCTGYRSIIESVEAAVARGAK